MILKRPTQTELLAIAFTAIRSRFPFTRADLKLPRKQGERSLRPHITVFDEDGQVLAAVEVTRGRSPYPTRRAQFWRAALKVPVVVVSDLEAAKRAQDLVTQALAARREGAGA